MTLIIFWWLIIIAAINFSKEYNIYRSEEDHKVEDDDRDVVVKSLEGLREMKRRMVSKMEEDGPESGGVNLKSRIANLDRMIEKTMMQLDEWDQNSKKHSN